MSKMKKILLLFVLFSVFAAIFVYARILRKTENFAQAEDFPREALIYIQTPDLPNLIKIWQESDLQQKYLESQNFAEFQNNHLALKLIERWNETGNELGFFADLATISGLSETKAALAVYDVGKLEFVFVAPMSEEKILASVFYQNFGNFEEILLEDGTKVYTKEMEVDRGRQTQKVFFTNIRRRFVLATSEKYLFQTLANINGKSRNKRLSDEPDFQKLAAKTSPKLATVWLNQAKLNDDWYFKHYWLMSDVNNLKNLRAGMFDFEIQEDKLVEKRIFLTDKNVSSQKINLQTANRLMNFVPKNAPFYKIRDARQADFGEFITEKLFDANNSMNNFEEQSVTKNYSYYQWQKSWSYSYLDSDFEENVDENGDENAVSTNFRAENSVKLEYDLSEIIKAGEPSASVEIFSPQDLPVPLFFENQKAVIFSLESPSRINRQTLENKLIEIAKNQLSLINSDSNFEWKDLELNDLTMRECKMPSLGWKFFYGFKNKELIFSNSEKLLQNILSNRENSEKLVENFNELARIRLAERETAFNLVMRQLRNEEVKGGEISQSDFFVDNIGSLLDVLSDVREIQIKKTSESAFLFEEINFLLK